MGEKVNEAQERYLDLVAAMDEVQAVLDEAKVVLKSYSPDGMNWRTRSVREFQALRLRAQNRLDDMRDTAKNYERDMVAKEWRP